MSDQKAVKICRANVLVHTALLEPCLRANGFICFMNEKCKQHFWWETSQKRILSTLGHRQGDIIKINHRDVAYEGLAWIQLAKDRVQRRTFTAYDTNLRLP
jgi:hypothetical protein